MQKISTSLLPILLVSLVHSALRAHDGEHEHTHAVDPVEAATLYAPSPVPDRIILTLKGDPRTTQAVNWRTSQEVAHGIAEIALAEDGPGFPKKAVRVDSVSQILKSDLNTARYHSVQFKDLEPGRTYAYRVGDGANWSEWFHFRTASQKVEPFSFVYFGDAQNNIRSMWSRVIREAYRDAPKAAFLLHAGDLINTAESDADWGEWFGAGAWLNAMTPSVAIPGNHEQAKNEDGSKRLSHHWRAVFNLPENGPEGLEETCFTLTYQDVRMIGLNSSRDHERQAAWLENVLSKNESKWIICSFHHPLFSTGNDRDNPALRALWKPIFDKYHVDLVLQGHDHTYGRTGFQVPHAKTTTEELKAWRPANATQQPVSVGDVNVPTGIQMAEKGNTIYVVSVSGPKMYSNTRYGFMKRVAEDTQLYQIIHIDGDVLRFEARTAIGNLYDAFELHKHQGSPNTLVELEPEMSARLRPAQ